MQVHLTLKSANAKTGPIPVSTTERASCPPDCSVRDACYAASGPLALHWAAVSNGTRGTAWGQFTASIAALPDGQLWRHNQAGDLPQVDGTVDAVKLGQLVAANAGKRGFTYSHHRDTATRSATHAEPEPATHAEPEPEEIYLARARGAYVSHLWNTGGREYFQNKRGRCEDAPCCGCCNI